MHGSAARGGHRWWLAVVAALLLGAGFLAWTLRPSAEGPPERTPTAADASLPRESATPRAVRAGSAPGAPERVMIFRLGVNARVVPVRAPRGTLVPPRDATRLGWWADGARPGDARGSALVAGHSLHTGGGALNDLEDLRRGDRVAVSSDTGSVDYAVTRVDIYSKGELARRAEQLFSQDVSGRLVLITCERWDGERYLANVVVTAEPTDRP